MVKVRLAKLYEDEDADAVEVLLDEGQDFPALYREFNGQDDPSNEDWLSFTDFMKSKGVKLVECENDPTYDPTAC